MPGKIGARLAELAATGCTVEVTGTTARRSVGGAAAGLAVAGVAGAIIGGAGRSTEVIVRDGRGGVKVTEVHDAGKAHAFAEAFAALAAVTDG